MKALAGKLFAPLLLILLTSGIGLAADNWPDVVKKLETANAQSLQQAQLVDDLVQNDRETLKAVLRHYQQQVATTEAQLKPLTQEYARLKDREAEYQKDLSQEREEIEKVQGTVFGFARQSADLFEKSPLGVELKAEREAVAAIAARKHFPGMAEIKAIIGLFERYRQESGGIRAYDGEFVGRNGRPTDGKIVRIGALAAVYGRHHEQGFLVPTDQGHELSAITGSVPGRVESAVEDFIKGKKSVLPLDLSGGAAFLKMTKERSFVDSLKAGGPLVWPILGLGVLALVMAIVKGIFFLRIRGNSDRISHDISQMVERNEIADCVSYCEKNSSFPTCQVLANGLRHLGHSQQVLENALHEALLQQIPRFERFLPTLAMFAGIAPLLGLLGTVTGMISTFQVINLFGTGDPRMMSGGISEALITTELGLAVAIPIMFVHHVFERKVDAILTDMEEKGTAFMVTMLKNGQVTETETGNEQSPVPAGL